VRHRPRPLMPTFVPFAFGPVFFAVGLLVAFADPRTLLQYDRRTGAALYRSVLERGGTEEQALAAARQFYRIFGLCFGLGGALICTFVGAMAANAP
jgi:hypothetical protein